MIVQAECPACGSFEQARVHVVKNWLTEQRPAEEFNVVRCTACGMLYLSPRPEAQEIGRYYPRVYFNAPNFLTRFVKQWLLKRQIRALQKRAACGRVLEIGCGTGDFLKLLADTGGCEVFGVEPDPYACEQARSRGLEAVQNSTVENALLPETSFDVVIMRHVLEHVACPRQVIEKVHRLLKPGGLFIAWLPFAGTLEQKLLGRYWPGFDAPRHFVHFSVRHLQSMLESAGFDVKEVRHEAIPNFWIIGIRNYLQDHGMFRLSSFFNDKMNIPLLLIFGIIAVPLALCGGSGQGKITATKRVT